MKQLARLGVLLSLIVFCSSSQAMDCRLGEENYVQAKFAACAGQSIEWLQRSIAVCPNFNAWYMLGLLYKNQDQMDEAMKAFVQAGENAATSKAAAIALGRQGELLAENEQLFQALHALEVAKRMHPAPAPDWLEKSLKHIRIQSNQVLMPADEIVSYLQTDTQMTRDRSIAIRPGVNIPVQFEFDRSDLNISGIRQVAELGAALTRDSIRSWSFLLVGHTDKLGTPAYNQVLSEKRAQSVKRELGRQFPSLIARLKTEGRGETELLYDGDTESDHMLNRRVKVTLIDSIQSN
jgi:outer membrane protein OmpA-like peptidoglycan-associated protein